MTGALRSWLWVKKSDAQNLISLRHDTAKLFELVIKSKRRLIFRKFVRRNLYPDDWGRNLDLKFDFDFGE
jgi:hypothetical protein